MQSSVSARAGTSCCRLCSRPFLRPKSVRSLVLLLLPVRSAGAAQPIRRFAAQASQQGVKRILITDTAEFCRAYLAPYQLTDRARQLVWRSRAFWALIVSGSAYGFCRLWETHQSRKADPHSLHLPFLGAQVGLSRWSLIGPYSVFLVLSTSVFATWRLIGAHSAAAAAPLLRASIRGAELFLRLFIDKPGLGVSSRVYSQPLLSPLGAALSHRTVGHFLVNQFVLFGALTCSIGKLSPGEFASFCISAACVTSLCGTVAMCLTRQFAHSLGASGVLAALVSYNALTGDADHDSASQSKSANLAILGVVPLTWLTPTGALTGWAGIEAACWTVAALRGRLPRFNHAVHLGGIGFGCAYAVWGHRALWSAHPVPDLNRLIRQQQQQRPPSV